ncbi:hypothetical protein GPALN_006072 [Globodera pallida]|nr:hypothetical protein GPALN_006072 [Globodera pallida]
MASSDLTLFNLATVFVVLLIQTVQFSGCQTTESPLPSPTSNASDGFNAEELCRPIEGTAFHEQCLQSEVVKQGGFIPRHLRPPWLNSSLFEDNQLPEEKAAGNGCYACYKGSSASNGVNPDEEYCACAFKYGAPNKMFGKIFGTFNVNGSTCLQDLHKMALMPTCGNEFYDYVHFYKNEPETEPDDFRHERTLVLLDGCITGASHSCTANVTIQFAEPPKKLSIGSCNAENKTVFESTIHLRESSGKLDIGGASSFTFPVEFKHRICVSWLQFAELRALPFYQLITGRVQEMRGLHLDLRGEVEAVQWRDPFGAYDFVQHNDLSWQPTDLNLIDDYGMPNHELMYPNFALKSIGHANFSVDILKMFYHYKAVKIYEKNAVLSPISAAIALATAYIGARGQTAVELGKVLAGDLSDSSLRVDYGKFLQEIGSAQTDANFTLRISNKLYLADSVKVLDEFKSAINTQFGEGNFESIDFRQQNAVANMDMMLQIGQFMHMEEERFELLGVPYVGEEAHFVILLPKPYKLYVLQEFKGTKLMEFVKKAAMKELKVILPKFKIVSLHHSLEEILLLLGIKRAFRPSKADFSGINYNNLSYTLYINKVIQKAHISVYRRVRHRGVCINGCGAEEYGQLARVKSCPPPTFQADRPFAFFLILRKKHVIFSGIFMGEQ